MQKNAQVVFRFTFVSKRDVILDLYLATLKSGTPSLNAEFSFVFHLTAFRCGSYLRVYDIHRVEILQYRRDT